MLVGAVVRRFAVASITCASVVAAGVTIDSASVSAAGFGCSSGAPVYSVRPGDGWYAIAGRVGVSAASLLAANEAAVDDPLVPGDELCLPDGADLGAACEASHTVASGDGWFSIAARAGVAVSDVLAINGAPVERVLHPGNVVCLPANARMASQGSAGEAQPASGSSGATYTVARGDSWFAIAERSHVSLRQLLAANDAAADDRLWPGDVVRLPAGATALSVTATRSSGGVSLDAAPVQGPCWYFDTWQAPRGGGRRHMGVDIITSPGRYVYAVADGRLTGRAWDQPGRRAGNAWHLTAGDGTRYFYAHLSDFAPGLEVGSQVKAGQIIGWVGETGNAGGPHLHFEVHPGGTSTVNPYPIVNAAGGCNRATPYVQPSGWTPDAQR